MLGGGGEGVGVDGGVGDVEGVIGDDQGVGFCVGGEGCGGALVEKSEEGGVGAGEGGGRQEFEIDDDAAADVREEGAGGGGGWDVGDDDGAEGVPASWGGVVADAEIEDFGGWSEVEVGVGAGVGIGV